jgi:hypothetical protein
MVSRALVYLAVVFLFVLSSIHAERTGSEIRDQGWAAAVNVGITAAVARPQSSAKPVF